jgi:transposase
MNNYNTRKHLFETNFKNSNHNPNEFKLQHDIISITDQREDDNHIYLVANSTSSSAICPHCQKKSVNIKDKKTVYPLVGVFNAKSVIMKFTKARFKCTYCNVSFAEQTPGVQKRKQLSDQIWALIYSNLTARNNYTKSSKNAKVSISTVIRYLDNMNLNNLRYSKVENILIDELRLVSYNNKVGKFQFVIIDADTGVILDILYDRRQKAVLEYLKDKFTGLELKTVTMDLWNPYKRAVQLFNEHNNSNVQIIADKFHFVRQLMWDLDSIRISEYELSADNFDKYKILKSSANILRKRSAKLTYNQQKRLNTTLEQSPTLYVAYRFKERYLDLIQSAPTKTEFIAGFKQWATDLQQSKIQTELFKRTLTSHINFIDEISNAFNYSYSNGYIEGANCHMKLQKANAYGFRNFERTAKYMKITVGQRKMI